jgi:NAD-dependent dihydropyrimidine dehydrogenase PreA subunit
MFLVTVDLKKCSCCGVCITMCPVDVFQECPEGTTDPLKSGGCIGCMSCIDTCPEKCIEVTEI